MLCADQHQTQRVQGSAGGARHGRQRNRLDRVLPERGVGHHGGSGGEGQHSIRRIEGGLHHVDVQDPAEAEVPLLHRQPDDPSHIARVHHHSRLLHPGSQYGENGAQHQRTSLVDRLLPHAGRDSSGDVTGSSAARKISAVHAHAGRVVHHRDGHRLPVPLPVRVHAFDAGLDAEGKISFN